MPKLSMVTPKPRLKLLDFIVGAKGNVIKEFIVKKGKVWRIKAIEIWVITDDTVIERTPSLQYNGGKLDEVAHMASIYIHFSDHKVTATSIMAWCLTVDFPQVIDVDCGDGESFLGFIPDVPLVSPASVRVALSNGQEGDLLNIFLYGEEL